MTCPAICSIVIQLFFRDTITTGEHTMTTTTTRSPELFETVGSSVRTQYARRADGVWFSRSQYRDPRYGWRWTRWQRDSEPNLAEWNDGVEGHSDGWWSYGVRPALNPTRVRLPRD